VLNRPWPSDLGEDNKVTGADLLDEAVAELYSADPEGFMARRQELAVHAREAGQAPAAKKIAALRKPTRTAWMINQFARSDPDAITRLTDLGTELRTAERAGDGRRLRELSQTRRQLVATLVRRALENAGQAMAPAGMREEITATFAAALADAEVAEQIRQGTLVRAQRRSGFGTAEAPILTVVPPLPESHRTAKPRPKPRPKPKTTTTTATTTAATTAVPTSNPPAAPALAAKDKKAGNRAANKAQEQAAHQQRLVQARAKAEQALADADLAVAAAAQDQRDQEKAIRRLERELATARGHLRAAAVEVRRAEAVQRRARQALGRLPES
jgi:hypothetical protein